MCSTIMARKRERGMISPDDTLYASGLGEKERQRVNTALQRRQRGEEDIIYTYVCLHSPQMKSHMASHPVLMHAARR